MKRNTHEVANNWTELSIIKNHLDQLGEPISSLGWDTFPLVVAFCATTGAWTERSSSHTAEVDVEDLAWEIDEKGVYLIAGFHHVLDLKGYKVIGTGTAYYYSPVQEAWIGTNYTTSLYEIFNNLNYNFYEN